MAGYSDHRTWNTGESFTTNRHFEGAFQYIGYLLVRMLVFEQNTSRFDLKMGNGHPVRMDHTSLETWKQNAGLHIFDLLENVIAHGFIVGNE